MPPTPVATPPSDEIAALGKALLRLRLAAGMSQEQAAHAYGVRRQAWQQYEAGERQVVLRVDVQERLAAALGTSRDHLLVTKDEILGHRPGPINPLSPASHIAMGVPVWRRTRPSTVDPISYEVGEPDSMFDIGWAAAGSAGAVRVMGDTMSGYVESGQLVIFDRSRPPRRGEGCVVETKQGEMFVKEYVSNDGLTLTVSQRNPEATLHIPMRDVQGVYAIRLRGE